MSAEKRFLFTGFASAPKRRLITKIKDLGGCALSPKDLKLDEEFILICAQPKWTEKFITACSAGMWILQPEYIERSCVFGFWLRESQFEWSLRKRDLLGSGFGDGRLLEAPQRWRIEVASGGKKAFHGWNVLFMVKQKMNKEAYTRMLTFGGAVVIRKRECLSEDVWKSLTHVFVDEDFCHHHADIVRSLINEGFQCLSPNYIRDYIAQMEPPNVADYSVGSPELFQTAPKTSTLLKSLVVPLPLKDSVDCTKPRKTRGKADAQLQTRHGIRDRQVLEALRKSILELMPSSLISCKQREQLLNQDAIVVVDSLKENLPRTKLEDEPKIKRLEEKSSLVKYSTSKGDGKTRKEDIFVELQCNVAFEDISFKETCDTSSEINCAKETLELRAISSKKRRIPDDVGFSWKRKKPVRLLSNLSNKLQRQTTNKRSLLLKSVLNEMTAQQTKGNLNKKPVEPSSAQSPLSHRLPLSPRQVASETRALQVNPSILNETGLDTKESSRNRKENLDLFVVSSDPASRVKDSHGSGDVTLLSEDASLQDISKNCVGPFSSSVSSFSPLKQNSMKKLNKLHEVVEQQSTPEEQKTDFFTLPPSDCDSILCTKESSVKNSDELLNSDHFQPAELGHSNTLNSNGTDPKPSSVFRSEFSNSYCSERMTLNHPVMFNNSECMSFSPSKQEMSIQDCNKSNHLVNTESNCIESGKSLVFRDETNDRTYLNKPLPDSVKKHQFSNAAMMFIDACLNAEEETRSNGRDSVKKFVDAVSFFVSLKSYPPSATLTLLLKMLIEERGLDERHKQQISTLLERILWLHEPTSASMKQVYVEALSHVSKEQQNWQLVDYLFRKVIERSDESHATNGDILFLRFIVRFLELDFLESKKRLHSAGHGRSRSVRWCVLAQWLWTNEFAAVRSTQFVQLVAVLVTAVRLKNCSAQMAVVGLAQKLVAMGAEAWLLSLGISTETSGVPHDPWLLALVIAEKLADERTRCEDLKLFLETSECDWLAMVICRTLVDRMNPDGIVANSPLSLRMIVAYFDLRPFEEMNEVVDPKAKSERLTPSKVSLNSAKPPVKRRQKLKDVNKKNSKGETDLHVACRKNNITLVRELLQTPGVDVNRADNAGWTPLHEACNRGNVEVVRELLQFKPKRTINSYFTVAGPSETIGGVDVRAASHEGGITPLHDAVLNSHLDVCRLMLQHAGPQLLELVDKKGKQPTDYARMDEMRVLLSGDASVLEEVADRKTATSSNLPSTSLSSTQPDAAQNNTSATETGRPSQGQSSSTQCHVISSDCSQRYCILVSSLVTFYVSWKKDRLTADDREILRELPTHALRLRRNLMELQNGKLLTGQMAALAQLEALADLQMVAIDETMESL